jgi:tRNA threonylcarbamoyladenosine biosynthesis protein TsaB
MLILTLRTDKPEAELGLYEDRKELSYETWQAHRLLAETLHAQIIKDLQAVAKELKDIEGIVCYKGPGSFTGLRIGMSVANALAYSYGLPIVSQAGENWQQAGIERLLGGEKEPVALPEYGGEIFTTKPKK